MKKALFILIIGFAGCKQATSGGGGGGDNPLIGTWVNIDRWTNIDNENDWREEKTVVSIKNDIFTETVIEYDYGSAYTGTKAKGSKYTMYYNYTISTEPNEHGNYVLELAPYDYTWDANYPGFRDLKAQGYTDDQIKQKAIESSCIPGKNSRGRSYKFISDTKLIFGMEYYEEPGTYMACDPDVVYTKQ